MKRVWSGLAAILVSAGIGLNVSHHPHKISDPVVGYHSAPLSCVSFGGYYVTNLGQVTAINLNNYGSARNVSDIVGMTVTEDCRGYWLVGADGGVFTFGDAKYLGSLPGLGITPPSPIIGMGMCNSGAGYYLVNEPNELWPFNCNNPIPGLP